MSYEIIKNIKIVGNKVMIKSASNNVVPRTPHWNESSYCANILKEKGLEALEVDLVQAYASGSFQGGNNKYSRAWKVLRHLPEYKKFDWRGDWDSYKENMEKEKEEFYQLCVKALQTKLPKDKFVIVKPRYEGNPIYYKSRKGQRFCRWYEDKAEATKFDYMEDALSTIKSYTNSDNWYVMKIS